MNDTTNNHCLEDVQIIRQQISGLHALRESAFQKALALSEEFVTRRDGAKEGFSNLVLQVRARNDGRSVGVTWALMHFKGRKFTGTTLLPKPRGAVDYDLATVKRKCPDWLHDVAVDIEMRARPLRETLARLTKLEQDYRYIAPRLGVDLSDFYASTVKSNPDDDLSQAFPTGDDQ